MADTTPSKYDIVVHMDHDDVHTWEVRWIGRGQRVLECGCDTGYVSKVLSEDMGCRVTGIELNPAAAERARAFCDEVIVADLDGFDFETRLAGRTFDVILFGDVLEHLKDPWDTLRRVRAVLEPGGRVIASIPNIAERNVILNLMLGRFDYQRLGLLDDTHLRFFTSYSTRRLFTSCGYVISRLHRLENAEVEREVPVDLGRFPHEVLRFLEDQNPDLRTIQFVVEAYPATEAGTLACLEAKRARMAVGASPPPTPPEPAEASGARAFQDRVAEFDAWQAALKVHEAELAAEVAQLRQALAEATHERGVLRTQLEDARARSDALAASAVADQDRLIRQQDVWAAQLSASEARWQQRLAEEVDALRAELHELTRSSAGWRERAVAAEAYSERLRGHPLVRTLRAARDLVRVGTARIRRSAPTT